MTSEESLTRRFERILDGIDALCSKNSSNPQLYTTSDNFEKRLFLSKLKPVIDELEHLGIEKVKLEEAIQKILRKIEEDVRKILMSAQLTETERRIKQILQQMRGEGVDYFTLGNVTLGLRDLRELSVSEHDLEKARERVLRVLERLVQAAEKLE